MKNRDQKTILEKFLALFAEVKSGEGLTAVLLMLIVFLVLTSYYIAKVVREPLILAGGGAELKSYLAAAIVLVVSQAVRGYAWLASKVSRTRLIDYVTVFFAGCMVAFYFLSQFDIPFLGAIFFVWVGMFAVMGVAQAWSFANDIYTPEAGKRLFAIVAFGGSAGAVAGSYLPKLLIDIFGLYPLLLIAAGVLLVSLLLVKLVDTREGGVHRADVQDKKAAPDDALGKEGAFKLVFQNKYLLMIAILILLLNWVNTTGEFILGRTVQETAEKLAAQDVTGGFSIKEYIGEFYAEFFTIVNVAVMLIQLFLVSRIIKYLGIRIAILILPVIAFGGYMFLAFYPLLNFVRWAKTAENSTDYSLNNTVRHALFLPTSREEKYKAKQAIDSFFHRSGDVLSALLVFVGTKFLSFQTMHFALFNLALVSVWLLLAIWIGRENKRLTAEQ